MSWDDESNVAALSRTLAWGIVWLLGLLMLVGIVALLWNVLRGLKSVVDGLLLG